MKLLLTLLASANAVVYVRLGLLAAFDNKFCPASTNTPVSTAVTTTTNPTTPTNNPANCAVGSCPVGTGKCISADRRAKGIEVRAAFKLACDFFSGTPARAGSTATGNAGKRNFFSLYNAGGTATTEVKFMCDINPPATQSAGHAAYTTANQNAAKAVNRGAITGNGATGGYNVDTAYLLLMAGARAIARTGVPSAGTNGGSCTTTGANACGTVTGTGAAKTVGGGAGTGLPVVAVIGASRSSASTPSAQYFGQAGIPGGAIPQISYGSTSSALSNGCASITRASGVANTVQTTCPKFFRVVAPDTFQANALVQLLAKWQVTKVGIIWATGDSYTVGLNNNFRTAWNAVSGNTIVGSASFATGTSGTTSGTPARTNAWTAVKVLKDVANGSAVNLIFTKSGDYVNVLTAAKALSMTGTGWTWIGGDSVSGVAFAGSTSTAAARALTASTFKGLWATGLTMASAASTITAPGKSALTATWADFTNYWKAKCQTGTAGATCRAQYQGLVNADACHAQASCSRVRAYVAHVVDAVVIAGNAAWRQLKANAASINTDTARQATITRANMFTQLSSFKAPASAANGAAGAQTTNRGPAAVGGVAPTKTIAGFTTSQLGFTKNNNGVPAYSLMQVQTDGFWACAGTWSNGATAANNIKIGNTGASAVPSGDCRRAQLFAGTGTAVSATRPSGTPSSTATQSPASLYTATTALFMAILAYLL